MDGKEVSESNFQKLKKEEIEEIIIFNKFGEVISADQKEDRIIVITTKKK